VDKQISYNSEKPGHFCGVAGIFSKTPVNIPRLLYFPLFSLQHRGQESAGVAYRKGDTTVAYKDLGMVSQVLSRYHTMERSGHTGIGHVRYSTHGGNKIENAQPLVVKCNKGWVAIAHNGNLTNTEDLRNTLIDDGAIFQTTSDTEVFLHLLSRSRANNFDDALKETLLQTKGAFSLVIMHDDTLYAIRDPWGFRPLYIGYKDDMTVIGSETCALDIMSVQSMRSLEPGEVVKVDFKGQSSWMQPRPASHSQCVFELIYFARPDSKVYDYSVYQQRKAIGKALALADSDFHAQGNNDTDIVVPVPDSGNTAALGYAEASGLPFELGLTRNHYTGRSFIMPTTNEREMVVKMKLHPVREAIQGKRVFLVDDSLVRGTTARLLVKLIREAGAREIHLRLSSPEIRWPCFFGIDIPTRNELISNIKSPEEIAQFIGADSVRFLSIQELQSTLRQPHNFCYSCFSGTYCMDVKIRQEDCCQPRDGE
jgi:amidophosphoribosyltransferase